MLREHGELNEYNKYFSEFALDHNKVKPTKLKKDNPFDVDCQTVCP